MRGSCPERFAPTTLSCWISETTKLKVPDRTTGERRLKVVDRWNVQGRLLMGDGFRGPHPHRRLRFLFTFAGGVGHFLPTLPFARALAGRGHEVRYACQAAMVDNVVAEGWTAIASGGATLISPSDRRPLVPVDRTVDERSVGTTFAGRVARE